MVEDLVMAPVSPKVYILYEKICFHLQLQEIQFPIDSKKVASQT